MATESQMPRIVQAAIQALIVYSVVTITLETMPELDEYDKFFRASEVVVVILFTIEYLWRWSVSKERLRYPFRPMAIIDLLSILPFYLELSIDLRSVRSFRLMRIFRILKLGRYNRALQMLYEALRRCVPELIVMGMFLGIVVIVASTCLYYAEHGAQPDVYRSIPATFWWAVVTLTTVGYGDAYPITPAGKLIAAVVMLTGIAVIAVPTAVISSSVTEVMRERREIDAGGRSAD